MNETAPALASVIVLKIQDFTRRTVAEQARYKSQLEVLVTEAIRTLPAAGRIVLDTPDGIAIVALGGPRQALELAQRSQAAAAEVPLRIGINHGPLRPASDPRRGSGVIGDGVTAAATVAGVATPGRLLASRAFRDALAAVAPDSATALGPAGTYTDASVRTHELYTPDPNAALARRRHLVTVGVASAAAILGLGVGIRVIRHITARPLLPAVIVFEITPVGEVLVDGVAKGKSPPLARLEVSPGRHTIEVRNSPYPPLVVDVNLQSEESITVRHSFTKPKPRSKDAGDYVRDLRRRLGL